MTVRGCAVLLLLMAATAVPGKIAAQAPASACAGQGADTDEDGLTDACEMELLVRFAPSFVASASACNWDADAGRLRGGYLIAAAPTEGGVRLAYLPAYLEDCGWAGPKCLLRPRGGCDPHAGDSEAVFLDVARAGSGEDWTARRIFLSAHCFGHSDGRCRWFAPGS